MRKTYISRLSILLAFFIAGCSKAFTDLNPVSQRNVDNFYKTEGDFITAVNATYKALQLKGAYNQGYWIVNELRSDNTDAGSDIGGGDGPFLNAVDNFVEDATATIISDVYFDSYVGVGRANVVLSRIDGVDIPEASKNQLKGEALFLRSLFYYNLAVAFGNIPLVLKEISVEEGKSYLQIPASAVYAQLITDLELAETNLPVKYTAAADAGRATKAAAATLLAKVYLTTGNKQAAIPVLKRIIDQYQPQAGYIILDDYSKLWGIANKNNKESIFEVQFKGGGFGTGNYFTNTFSDLLPHTAGSYKNRPTAQLEAAFETVDKRAPISFNRLNGPLTVNRFILKYGTTNSFTELDADYNFPVFRFSDVYLLLAEALGESTQAYDLINTVRAKHGGLDPIDAATTGTFEEKLLHERHVEFAFENQRWPDLLRFGKAKSILEGQGKSNVKLLFLIPQKELDINDLLKQN